MHIALKRGDFHVHRIVFAVLALNRSILFSLMDN